MSISLSKCRPYYVRDCNWENFGALNPANERGKAGACGCAFPGKDGTILPLPEEGNFRPGETDEVFAESDYGVGGDVHCGGIAAGANSTKGKRSG